VLGGGGWEVMCGGDVLLHNGLKLVDIAANRELRQLHQANEGETEKKTYVSGISECVVDRRQW
jgi:hypothetical protein